MRILIAYDSSPGAEQALALVSGLRWPADSKLRIVTAIEPTLVFMGTAPTGLVPNPRIDAQIRDFAEERIAAAAERMRASVEGQAVETAVLLGRPGTVLVDEARRMGADVVVVGSRGHGPITTLLLGSVSAEVVDHAPCPVLVARGERVTRVLFATDDSPAAEATERLLAAWPVFEGLPIEVVSVADVVEPWHAGIAPTMYHAVARDYAQDLAAARAEATRIAEDAAQRLRAAGHAATPAVRAGHAGAEVIAAASDSGADLVVMGSRGRTGLTRMILGSVARNVLEGSQASVLIVHAAAERP